MKRALLPLVGLWILCAGVPAQARTVSIAVETLRLTPVKGAVAVTDAIELTPAPRAPVAVGLFPGARSVRVVSGRARVERGTSRVLVPPGEVLLTLRYLLPAVGTGVSLVRDEPLPVHELWVLSAPGIDFPIELNQAFYDEGTTAVGGVRYHQVRAQNVGPGPMRFNFQVPPGLPPLLMEGALVLMGGMGLVVTGLFLERRSRRPRDPGREPNPLEE